MRSHLRWVLPMLALLVTAATFGAARASSATPCWQRVIADWADNGTVDGSYAPGCYRAAMANAPTDLRIYSTIEDDLRFALQNGALRRISSEAARKPAAHLTTARAAGSSTSPMVAALGAGLGIIGLAISVAIVVGRRRRRA